MAKWVCVLKMLRYLDGGNSIGPIFSGLILLLRPFPGLEEKIGAIGAFSPSDEIDGFLGHQ